MPPDGIIRGLPWQLLQLSEFEKSYAQTVASLLKRSDWQSVLPDLDRMEISHPLDFRGFQPAIHERIFEIASEVNAQIGLLPDDPEYCDSFVPMFYWAGIPSFEEGGLCFGYPAQRSLTDPFHDPELTAGEAFDACLERENFYGTCTEATYKIEAAFAAAGVPCKIVTIHTENHIFPRYYNEDGVPTDLDPSGVGAIGWEREVNPAALYIWERGRYLVVNDEAGAYSASYVTSLIDPVSFPNFYGAVDLIIDGSVDEGLSLLDAAIKENGKEIWLFLKLSEIAGRMLRERSVLQKLNVLPNPAISFGMKVLKRWPNNPYRLMPLLSISQQDQSALPEVINRLSREMPGTGLAKTVEAFNFYNAGDLTTAMAFAQEALETDPQNAYALQIIAGGHLTNRELAKAREVIQKAMAVAPNMAGNHSLLATILELEGDLEGALEEIRKETLVFLGNPVAFVHRARIYASMGWPKTAERMIEELIAKDPRFEIYRPLLVDLKFQAGEIDDARKDIERSLVASPQDSRLLGLFAIVEFLDLNIDKGWEYLQKAQSNGSSEINLLAVRVYGALMSNDVDEARRVASRIRALLDEAPFDYLKLQGDLAFAEGKFDEMRQIGEQIVQKNKYDIHGHAFLVRADLFGGNLEAARVRIDELRREFPEVYLFHSLDLVLKIREGNYEDAWRLMAEDQMVGRSFPSIDVFASGALLLAGGDNLGTLDVSLELMEKVPRLPTGWLLAARALLNLGDIDGARLLAIEGYNREICPLPNWPLLDAQSLLNEIDRAERGE